MATEPLISPDPPCVPGGLPLVGHGFPFLRNPTACLIRLRAAHGDTFLLDVFGFRLFFVFSATGLRSLYGLAEDEASFGEATRTLLGLKLPPELQAGDLVMFQHLFNRERMESYLGHIDAAVGETLEELGAEGTLEVFAHMKRLVHRIGFRCWAGAEAASAAYFDRMIACFERLDPEQAFVRPGTLFVTVITRKMPERRALRRASTLLREIWDARTRRGVRDGDLLEQLHVLFADDPEPVRHVRVAKNVMILHLASQANLYASLAWTLVNLLLRPEHRAGVETEARELAARYGASRYLLDQGAIAEMTLLESCANESIRLAQRSLTLRKVMRPCTVETERGAFTLRPGVFVATLLSVNNAAYDTLDRFDPAHYERGKLADRVRVPGKEVVSTFGHGRHACVGERFAMAAIKIAVARYLTALDLAPAFTTAESPSGQMGAVARAAAPCRVRYRRKAAA